ncbi:MAG: exosortase V [Sphingomonas sp.]
MTAASRGLPSGSARAWVNHWPLVLGFGVMALATMIGLARESWWREIGAHGPIVLATGAWLLVAQRPEAPPGAGPAPPLWVGLLAAPALALYVFGRAYDFISLEAAGLYGVMLAIALRLIGWRGMAAAWFPLFYLAFLIPPPGWMIDRFTSPLRVFVSKIVTAGLQGVGYPITRDGVTMTIAQYQLLVEDACSGLNSIIGLTAITLLYIYLMHRASWRYALLLVAFILPIAVLVNVIRVTALVLLTYYYGDAVAQGFLHVTTGMVLFMLALTLVFGLDALLQSFFARRRAA